MLTVSKTQGAKVHSSQPKASADKQPAEAFMLERPETKVRGVPFGMILARPEDYAFREGDVDAFSEAALRSLSESILLHGGLKVPLLLQEYGDGTFLLVDGHRRYFCLKGLIGKNITGFGKDMIVPANVLAAGTSELVMVASGVSANVERQPLDFEGRLKATKKLCELGMPRKSIAQVLHVSESTVDRDLLLAGDEDLMGRVRLHHISATAAASLLAAAEKAKRRDEFKRFLDRWVQDTADQIRAEQAARAARDETPLPVARSWPQSRMTPELVKQWRDDLEKGRELTIPGFRFKALLRRDGGRQRIEVDAISKAVDELDAADVAKVFRRCLDLAAELEPVLAAKAAEEKTSSSGSSGETASPGLRRLQELGFGEFVDELDEDGEDGSEEDGDEPGDEPEPDGE